MRARVKSESVEFDQRSTFDLNYPHGCKDYTFGTISLNPEGSYMEDVKSRPLAENPVFHLKWQATPGEHSQVWKGEEVGNRLPFYCPTMKTYWKTMDIPLPDIIDIAKSYTLPYPNPSIEDTWERLSNPFGNNFLETAAELQSLKGLFSSVGARLKYLKNVPKAIRPLQRNLTKGALKRMAKGISASTLSSYLEWEFGWRQTGEDIARMLAFSRDMLDYARKMEANQGKRLRVGFKNTQSRSGTFVGFGRTWSYQITGTQRISYGISYRYTYGAGYASIASASEITKSLITRLTSLQQYWGLETSAGNAWDLFPGSWLIDQFLPIGDLLDDLGKNSSFGVGHELEYYGATSSSKRTIELKAEATEHRFIDGAGNPWDVKKAEQSYTLNVFERSWSPSAPPSFSVRRPRMTLSNTGKAYLGLLALSK